MRIMNEIANQKKDRNKWKIYSELEFHVSRVARTVAYRFVVAIEWV